MLLEEILNLLDKIVIDTYNSIVDKMQNKYIQQEETSASVIFMGDPHVDINHTSHPL